MARNLVTSALVLCLLALLLASSSSSSFPAAANAAEQAAAGVRAAAPRTIQIPALGGAAAANQTRAFHRIPLPDGVTGAESLAFDRRGQGPYAGVSDGRILKWGGGARGWATFAYSASYADTPMCRDSVARPGDAESVCGRPLGLQFCFRTGDLYYADAYLGLMRVGPGGGVAESLATAPTDGGKPFRFVNGVDVDQVTGDVYFTDSSTEFTRARNVEIMLRRDATGRLLRYQARTGRVDVLRDGLAYPNGVALGAARTHLVVAHTGPCQAFRYWIRGPRAGDYERLADLPGYADNVRRDARGGYWFALNREKMQLDAAAAAAKHLVGVRISAGGLALQDMAADDAGVTLSDVAETRNGNLWLGSVELDYVVMVDSKLL